MTLLALYVLAGMAVLVVTGFMLGVAATQARTHRLARRGRRRGGMIR